MTGCCTPSTPQGVCCAPKPELAPEAPCCAAPAAEKPAISRLRPLPDPDHLPALDRRYALERPALDLGPQGHPPRILLLYGSLREVSYSRRAAEEAARLLRFFGAEPRIFDPSDLPFPDQVKGDDHPAVRELTGRRILGLPELTPAPMTGLTRGSPVRTFARYRTSDLTIMPFGQDT